MFAVPAAAGEVVDDRHLVAAGREPQGSRPAEVAVAPENENAHRRGRVADGRRRADDSIRVRVRAERAAACALATDPAARRSGCGSTYAWDGRASRSTTPSATRRSPRTSSAARASRTAKRRPSRSSNYSPGLPLFVAGLYKITGGAHERLARIVLALIGTLARPLRLSDRAPALGAGRRADRRRGGGDLPGAPRVPGDADDRAAGDDAAGGGRAGVLWAADRKGTGCLGAARALLLGALALARPEYLAVAVLLAIVVFLAPAAGRSGGRSLGQAAVMLAAALVVIAPWTVRNAVALDRFVPISTGGGKALFAGSYLPSDGDGRGRREAAALRATRQLARGSTADAARRSSRLASSRSSRRWRAQRYPELETDARAGPDGPANTLGRRHRRTRSLRRIRSPRRSWRVWARRAARGDARAGLGGPAVGSCSPSGSSGWRSSPSRRRWEVAPDPRRPRRDHGDERAPDRLAAAGAGDAAAGAPPSPGSAAVEPAGIAWRDDGAADATGLAALPERHGRKTLILLALILALGFGLRALPGGRAAGDPGRRRPRLLRPLEVALRRKAATAAPTSDDASDWSPGAPLLYAGVLLRDRRRARRDGADRRAAARRSATIVVVYLLGRRIAGRAGRADRRLRRRRLPPVHPLDRRPATASRRRS